MVETFVKKPVEIQAVQWTGDNFDEVKEFMGEKSSDLFRLYGFLYISTLEGIMAANVGHWVIRGTRGEFYTCRNDIFEDTYMKVERKENND